MAVLVEAISVIIRADAIEASYAGGLDAFEASIPNETACSDGDLVRVGFMTPADVQAYVGELTAKGLRYVVDGVAHDIVVVDQQRGPLARCDWIEAGRVSLDAVGNERIAIAQLVGSQAEGLATPPGWEFENSLSRSFGFSGNAEKPASGLRFLRHEDGMDVYQDDISGKEVFVGRPGR
jgi:hypothetical protein